MFCMNCGAKISDEALFCPKCGHRQVMETPAHPADQVQNVQPEGQIPRVQPAVQQAGPDNDSFKEQTASAARKSAEYVHNEVRTASSEAFAQAGSYVGDLKNAFVEEKEKLKGMFKGGLNAFKSGGTGKK